MDRILDLLSDEGKLFKDFAYTISFHSLFYLLFIHCHASFMDNF